MADTELKINEKSIPLKDFMQEMLANIILGYLKETKGIPDVIKTISINIQL